MKQRNNTRPTAALLLIIVLSLLTSCTMPSTDSQADKPIIQNEGGQDDLPKPSETSDPIQTLTNTPWPTKPKAPLPTNTGTPSATSLPSPTATIHGVYYHNNLDHIENSGQILPIDGITKEFLDGELIVQITIPSQSYTIELTDQIFSEAMITTWAMFEGSENASIGLFCNNITGKNSANYHYAFLISRSGVFSLDYRTSPTEGYRTSPTEGELTILETLAQGQTDVLYPPGPGVWNSIQAACIDQHLMFFVNGETLIDITLDHPVQAGTVGLVQATGSETEYLKVTWDMLTVSDP